MLKKRNVAVAGFFNLISPGLGYLYVGKITYAIVFPLVLFSSIVIFAWTKIIFNPLGFASMVVITVSLTIFGVVSASVMAYRIGEASLNKLQRWYIYIGFFVISFLLSNMLLGDRGADLGYDTFRIASSSMSNTLIQGDYIVSDTWKYKQEPPKRGDLVVFVYPKDPNIKYIMRTIGLPHDVVRIKNGKVFVNDRELIEPYVMMENNQRLTFQMPGEYVVPEHAYFVMGDNRDNSNDSRFWGFVPENNIYGSVESIWCSFNFDQNEGFRYQRIGWLVN